MFIPGLEQQSSGYTVSSKQVIILNEFQEIELLSL